jgi:energy-coupling factor transporter ATP-binding protein EcfA2
VSELATLIPPGGLPSHTAGKATFGVEAINMTKRFGEFAALDQVSLKVRPGTFHALLGENGAGKSTLVKCIMGYYQPDEGEVIVGDRQEAIGARGACARPRHGLPAFHAGPRHDRGGEFRSGARRCAGGGGLGA